MISLQWLDETGIAGAQSLVTREHYLKRPVDTRCSVQGYWVMAETQQREIKLKTCEVSYHGPVLQIPIGLLLFGRPEATRCGDWYGSVEDVCDGVSEVTRWQVLNLARVWFLPDVQPGGRWFNSSGLPGYTDRKGKFRSTLVSTAINMAVERIGYDYLMSRPPVFLDEPYNICWLLSYCDLHRHRGTIYKASGFELYRTNQGGIQTWRRRLPTLTEDQHTQVIEASKNNLRAQKYRGDRMAKQAQIAMF